MPVIFYVDPAIENDPDARDIQEITLSYTFYPVDSAQFLQARAPQTSNRDEPMAGAKNHQYHILPPSIWPFFGAMAALVLASGGIMWMHSMPAANLVFFAGVAGMLITMFGWWSDVIKEAHSGDHTPMVQLHLRYGMILFIASEVMFFVGWFWAWFDFSLFPSTVEAVGGHLAAQGHGSAQRVQVPAAQHADPAAARAAPSPGRTTRCSTTSAAAR
jgi:hypothetical protein